MRSAASFSAAATSVVSVALNSGNLAWKSVRARGNGVGVGVGPGMTSPLARLVRHGRRWSFGQVLRNLRRLVVGLRGSLGAPRGRPGVGPDRDRALPKTRLRRRLQRLVTLRVVLRLRRGCRERRLLLLEARLHRRHARTRCRLHGPAHEAGHHVSLSSLIGFTLASSAFSAWVWNCL